MKFVFPTQSVDAQERAQLASAFMQGVLIPVKCPYPAANTRAAEILQIYAQPESAGIEAIVVDITALAQAQQEALSFHASVQDWDMMFSAVAGRLSSAVGKVLVATSGLEPQPAAVLVQTIVLECVTDLGQLQATLTLERGSRRHPGAETELKTETHDAQACCAAAIAATCQHTSGKFNFVS